MEISVEITRKCNLRCLHCMRGEPQDVEISHRHLDIIVDYVKSFGIKRITLSGGEPFLAPKKITYLFNRLIEEEILVERYILTNGRVEPTDEVIEAVFYAKNLAPARQSYASPVITLSAHRFPDLYPEPLKFWKDLILYPLERSDYLSLRGRARKNKKILESKGFHFLKEKGLIPSVYITANGRVILDGDYEYDNQPEGIPLEDKEQFERVLQAVQQNVFA